MSAFRHIPLIALALAGAPVAAAQDVPASARRVLIDHSLQRTLVELESVEGPLIRTRDASGKTATLRAADYAAIVPAGDWALESRSSRGGLVSRAGVLELTDAQRLVGIASAADPGEERLAWSHARLGPLTLPLEAVRRVTLPRIMTPDQVLPPLEHESDDLLRLTNADTLRGFIVALGSPTTIELPDGSEVTTPLHLIDEATLANPPVGPEGMRLWLSEGSVLAIESIAASRDPESAGIMIATLAPEPLAPLVPQPATSEAGQSAAPELRLALDAAELRALSFDARALIPLAALPSVTDARALAIDHAGAPALGAADILMPGPMSATFDLPRGSTWLAFEATLPIEARDWGDLDLVIFVDNEERQRHPLSAASPDIPVRINIEGAQSLTLTLDEARFGPVQDRLLIRQAILIRR